MIEISLIDALFICWSGIASALACHFYAKERFHNKFVCILIEDKELRAEFFTNMDIHRKEKQT
jgi:hypothetical protein